MMASPRREAVNDEHGEYDDMQQLHMHCRYDATQVALVSSNEWLDGMNVDTMLERVINAPCTKMVEHLRMQSLEFDLHAVQLESTLCRFGIQFRKLNSGTSQTSFTSPFCDPITILLFHAFLQAMLPRSKPANPR
jgi:hypothetical protein